MLKSFAGKKVVLIGMARTGMAAAEVLKDLGARVVLYDRKPQSELSEQLDQATKLGVEARPGTEDVDLDDVDLVVTSPGVPITNPALVEARSRGIEVIAEIELAYRISPAPILAITGTNGKTTTTVLLGKMMEADGRDTFIAGNVVAGDIRMPLVLAAHRAKPDSVIVAEISTFQLEWIESFRPKVGALLNVTVDHMDRHSSIEEYADLKARLFENQRTDDFAVVNADNPVAASKMGQIKSRVLPFSRITKPEEGAYLNGDTLVVRIDGIETPVCTRQDIPLRGEHNVENVLAASAAAIAFGAKAENIARAVRDFQPVEHRMEPVAFIDGVEYINNSMCTNVDAAVRSIEAMDKPVVIIAGGKHKGGDISLMAQAIAKKAKHLVLIGASAALIESAVRDAGYTKISLAGDMQQAVDEARKYAQTGDAVLLAPGCASFDMFSGFEERGRVFKDIVKQYQK